MKTKTRLVVGQPHFWLPKNKDDFKVDTHLWVVGFRLKPAENKNMSEKHIYVSKTAAQNPNVDLPNEQRSAI